MPTIEELAMNDANQNKDMANDPNWTSQEREKYQAAYSNAKNKQQS